MMRPLSGGKAGAGQPSASALMSSWRSLRFDAFLHANRDPPRIECGAGIRSKTLWSLMYQIRRKHFARVGAALRPPFRLGQVLLEDDRQGMNVGHVKLAERPYHDIEP